MKSLLLATCALACGTAFAQAPPGVVQRPSAESSPSAAGGAPAAKAETKTDMKKGMGAMPGGGMGMGAMNMKTMDMNGDGMISKKEWMDHHTKMWGRMKTKNGMVPMADVEAMMKGGPN